MSFPNRPPYGASSPTPWSPSAGAGRGSSPGRWTPVGSPRGNGAQSWAPQPPGWAGVPPPGRPVTPVRSPGGRATPVQLTTPPGRPAPNRVSPARSVTPVMMTPARQPPSPGHQTTRDGRPMTPQRLFSPSRMMGSPAPQVRHGSVRHGIGARCSGNYWRCRTRAGMECNAEGAGPVEVAVHDGLQTAYCNYRCDRRVGKAGVS